MKKAAGDLTQWAGAQQPDSKGISKKILKKLTKDLANVGVRSSSRCKEGAAQPRLPADLLRMNKENISTSFLKRVSRLVGERKNDGLLKRGKKASRQNDIIKVSRFLEEAGSMEMNSISFLCGPKGGAKAAGSVRRARRAETQRDRSKEEVAKQVKRII